MDGANLNGVTYLGRREGTTYLFKDVSNAIIELDEESLYGRSILKVGGIFNIRKMRANCYLIN